MNSERIGGGDVKVHHRGMAMKGIRASWVSLSNFFGEVFGKALWTRSLVTLVAMIIVIPAKVATAAAKTLAANKDASGMPPAPRLA